MLTAKGLTNVLLLIYLALIALETSIKMTIIAIHNTLCYNSKFIEWIFHFVTMFKCKVKTICWNFQLLLESVLYFISSQIWSPTFSRLKRNK